MDDIFFLKRLLYRYLGIAYAFTHVTSTRKLLWVTIEHWLKLIAVVLFLNALLFRWGQIAVGVTAVILVWLYFSYWRANKVGYSKFIADSKMAWPEGELTTLPANQKIGTLATGIFSVKDMDDFTLLRPANYWQVPLGEHVMMVHMPHNLGFRYQFFNSRTLQYVQKGWLLYGTQPRRTLAITLLSEFGEAFVDQQHQFSFGREKKQQGIKRTVYLSFSNEADETVVWHNIVRSAKAARQP
ncbi:MAG: hypothetical protein CSA11_02670 [Chloroflexi bacterium]|nr:MAG: hypothetical protein CSA11_02670 [Chloroflexota bacterium]